MTIVLDITNAAANRVENYNDGETTLVTPDVYEAIDDAAITAEMGEATIRVRVGGPAGVIEIVTGPRALRLKVRFLQLLLAALHHALGSAPLANFFSKAVTTGRYAPGARTPAAAVEAGLLVATPLRVSTTNMRSDWEAIVYEVESAAERVGLGLGVNRRRAEGRLISIVVSDGAGANFVDGPSDLPPALYALMEQSPGENHWVEAVKLASKLPNVAGPTPDEDANAILFWERA